MCLKRETLSVLASASALSWSCFAKRNAGDRIPTSRCTFLNLIIQRLQYRGTIIKKQADFPMGKITDRERHFYLLPKNHKEKIKWPMENMPEGRPIVSDRGSESRRACEFVNYHLRPLANKHESYVKDSYAFARKIQNTAIEEK